jgi:micrococcal nuclease
MSIQKSACWVVCLLSLPLLIVPGTGQNTTNDWTLKDTYQVRVVEVIDGDTIRVQFRNGIKNTVQLLGIDTPETFTKNNSPDRFGYPNTNKLKSYLSNWGYKAREWMLKELLKASTTKLKTDEKAEQPDDDQLLAYVYFDGKCINKTLVKKGLARVHRKQSFSKINKYLKLEQQAKKQGRGVWSRAFNRNQYTEVAELLEKSDYDGLQERKNGLTDALFVASAKDHPKQVRKLLAKGASIKAKNSDGITALEVALRGGHGDVARVFFEKGAEVNVKEQYARTIYEGASTAGRMDIIDQLLDERMYFENTGLAEVFGVEYISDFKKRVEDLQKAPVFMNITLGEELIPKFGVPTLSFGGFNKSKGMVQTRNYQHMQGTHDLHLRGGRAVWVFEKIFHTSFPPITLDSPDDRIFDVMDRAEKILKAYQAGLMDASSRQYKQAISAEKLVKKYKKRTDPEVQKIDAYRLGVKDIMDHYRFGISLDKLVKKYEDKIKPGITGEDAPEYRKQFTKLLEEWMPIGKKVSELTRIVGEKPDDPHQLQSYSFDTGFSGLKFIFRVEDGKITAVITRGIS